MASFFFSDHDSARAAQLLAGQRPHLTTIQGGRLGTDAAPQQDTQQDTQHGSLQARRTEVSPPSLFLRSRPLWRTWVMGFWCWLWDMDDTPRSPAPTTGLQAIKAEFNTALWDLQSLRANHVRGQVEQARSLRELWHLRADVFKVISVHRGQIEAQLRLDTLDNHFPVRSSRQAESRASKVTTW